MRAPPPPLRFLALIVGLWICARAAILAPGWRAEPAAQASLPPPPRAAPPSRETQRISAPPVHAPRRGIPLGAAPPIVRARGMTAGSRPPPRLNGPTPALLAAPPAPAPPALPIAALPRGQRRWSTSAWVLIRSDSGGPALATGGTLGGSQAGARFLYRLGGGLGLSGRLQAPLRQIRGAEAAAGLDWQVSPRLPVHLLAERRQAIGRDGRSAFALILYGGIRRDLPHGLDLVAYGQAGVVGARARDPFADGAVRISARAGAIEVGGGAWGAAQPDASRLDAGPSVSWRLPVRGASLRLQADWRFRVAGDAAPGSGPAIVLAADF